MTVSVEEIHAMQRHFCNQYMIKKERQSLEKFAIYENIAIEYNILNME